MSFSGFVYFITAQHVHTHAYQVRVKIERRKKKQIFHQICVPTKVKIKCGENANEPFKVAMIIISIIIMSVNVVERKRKG